MARRLLFSSRRRAYGAGGGFDSPELRNAERELFLFRRRLGVAGVLVVAAFGALFARFVYLQVVQHRHYQTLAETNRIAIVPIVPNRGVITDRNGVVLAQSYSAYTLEIQPSRVKNLDETIDALAAIVDVQPRDRKRFKKLLEESRRCARGSPTTRSRASPSTATASRASRSRRGCSGSTRSARSPRT
jgi:penicillin-binding protein 2